jgi:hypothetical protein
MESMAIVLLMTVLAQQTPAVDEFRQADRATKLRILSSVGTARRGVDVTEIIALAREGIRDDVADVRRAALGFVAGRAMVSRVAGTPGAGLTSSHPDARMVIPASWKNDRQALLVALQPELVGAVRQDSDPRVRHEAILAIGLLVMPDRASESFSGWVVDLLLERYRQDADSRVRAEVVKFFRLGQDDSEAIRRVLIDALVDPDAAVRSAAFLVLRPPVPPARIGLQMGDVRPAIDKALIDGHAGVRLGAVRALNELGAQATSYVPVLDRLRRTDPDPQVRTSANLAIEAIQFDLRN